MPEYTVEVRTTGKATITAPTKAAAARRARAGDFDRVGLYPVSALISTLKEKP